MFLLANAGFIWGQNSGAISFGALSAPNPATGVQSCVVNWNGNFGVPTCKGINITISFSGVQPICIDQALTRASLSPAFTADLGIQPSNVSFTSSSVALVRVPGTPTFPLDPSYAPLITLFFRGVPGQNITLGASLTTIVIAPGQVDFIGVTPSTVTMAPGFNIAGTVQKLGGTPCSGGINNGITGVQLTTAFNGLTPACFPSTTPLPNVQTSSTGQYSVGTLPTHFNYSVTPFKNQGCNCGPEGPINSVDINLGRGFILGFSGLNLLQALIGDYNGNNQFTTFDLVLMSQCELGIPEGFQPPLGWARWNFIPATLNSPVVAALLNPPTTSQLPVISPVFQPIQITTMLPPGGVFPASFIGYRRGDIDQSCTDCGSTPLAPPADDRFAKPEYFTHISALSLRAGEEIEIPVLVDAIEGLSVFDFQLESDAQRVEVLSADNALDTDSHFNFSLADGERKSTLRCNWFTMEDGGLDLDKNSTLLTLRVRALSDIDDVSSVFTAPFRSSMNQVFFRNGMQQGQLQFGTPQVESAFDLRMLGSNVIESEPQVEVYSEQAQTINLLLTDQAGRVLFQRSDIPVTAGWSTLTIPMPLPTAGIYNLTCRSNQAYKTVRMVKQ
jgi:hypothetical protein